MNRKESDFQRLMDQYQQELMQLHRQASIASPELATEEPPATESPASAATLQVRVTSANQAVPIVQAVVTIQEEENAPPLHVLLTDTSGLTTPVLLPATNPALTEAPVKNLAIVTYTVLVTAPGYFSVRNVNVPLFGGIATVQPVAMIPLPEFEEPNATELFFSVPKNDL